MNKKVYTVSVINHYVAGLIEDDMLLHRVSVEGEVSNLTYHSSGHIYFTLKDEKSAIHAVMFRSYRSGLKFQMKAGDRVVVTGSIGVFEKGGTYQIYAELIEPAGEGELFAKVEALKKELLEMGMFDDAYKKPIPKYSFRIGVVTAPTGAVIHDIMQVSQRRNPHVQILLSPAQVQGEAAADSVAAALARIDGAGCDVIICGRGGGSLEDLMAFNTETVARAIFACRTPVISAVGHETDTTIADFVADLRAPTPSAAAELAVFSYDVFLSDIRKKRNSILNSLNGKVLSEKNRLLSLSRRVVIASPKMRSNRMMTELVRVTDRIRNSMKDRCRQAQESVRTYPQIFSSSMHVKLLSAEHGLSAQAPRLSAGITKKLSDTRHSLSMIAQRIDMSNPVRRIAAGFAYVSGENGRITRAEQVKEEDIFSVTLLDGTIDAKAIHIRKKDNG